MHSCVRSLIVCNADGSGWDGTVFCFANRCRRAKCRCSLRADPFLRGSYALLLAELELYCTVLYIVLRVRLLFSQANSKILSPLFAAYDAQLDEQAKTMQLYRVRGSPM